MNFNKNIAFKMCLVVIVMKYAINNHSVSVAGDITNGNIQHTHTHADIYIYLTQHHNSNYTMTSTATAATNVIDEDNECILKAYNSLTRTIEPVTSQDKTLLKWYICGPTVYDKVCLSLNL